MFLDVCFPCCGETRCSGEQVRGTYVSSDDVSGKKVFLGDDTDVPLQLSYPPAVDVVLL